MNTAVTVYAAPPGSGGGGVVIPVGPGAEVTKGDLKDVQKPTANDLKYNGTAQELVTWDWEPSDGMAAESVTKKYSLSYSTDIDDYSEDIPTATASGTYRVYYGIDGGLYYELRLCKSVHKRSERRPADHCHA